MFRLPAAVLAISKIAREISRAVYFLTHSNTISETLIGIDDVER